MYQRSKGSKLNLYFEAPTAYFSNQLKFVAVREKKFNSKQTRLREKFNNVYGARFSHSLQNAVFT